MTMLTNTPVEKAESNPTDPFFAVETALKNLKPGGSPGLNFLVATKNFFVQTRASVTETNRSKGGRVAGEVLSLATDRMLNLLLNYSAGRAEMQGSGGQPTGVALLAMGSYGRQELAPFSDIDFLILCAEGTSDEKLEVLMGHLLRPLWDAGLQIGHALRTPRECLDAMDHAATGGGPNAVETATSVLEARYVSGDRSFAENFLKADLPEFFRRRGRAFVDAKFEETIRRWDGLTVYRTQPNLKESPGALRDFQLALWIDQASQLSGHLPRLNNRPLVSRAAIEEAQAGYERLLTFRVSLHAHCRRKQDVLDFAMQQSVAEDLKYERTDDLKASEKLLRDYFRAATAVHRLAHTVTRRYLEERAVASRDIERLRRRRVDEDFTRIGDYLYASHDDLFSGPDWIEPAFRAFLHAARMSITIGQDVVEAIRRRLPEMTDELRSHPAAALHFNNLMRLRMNVARALRSMRDVGLLGSFLPEFNEIEGLAINDTYHDYTVDEHTLYVVDAVDRLYASVESSDKFRRRVLEALPRPHLLRLACLFHDLGKSRGAPGHSERGALMMPLIGERLGLSAADVRTLIFLVQEHLTLSKVSQRRDTGEGTLLQGLAEKVSTKDRLDLLFLLTYCDSISVGHGSYPMWKDALLQELYQGILQHIAPTSKGGTSIVSSSVALGEIATEDSAALETRLVAGTMNDEDRALAVEHCKLVPGRYLVEVSFEEAIVHIETLKRMRIEKREAVATVRGSGDLVDIWVVSTDRPKRFSQICGAFLGAGVSVISALAYTRTDGIILDHFRVSPGLESVASETFWAKVVAGVESALSGASDFLSRIESARKRIPREQIISRRIEPEIRVDNKLSDKFTIVDVICGDRIGLLYGLSRALADLSCNIHFAKISTNQGLVTDVFYISELSGGQIADAEKMLNVRRLLKAVAEDFQEAHR